MEVITYQCPNCAAPLEFNSETQKWDCKFCLSSFEESDLQKMQTQKTAEPEESEQDDQEQTGQKCYFCPNCGAEIVTDESTVASFCTFCGNPVVLPKKMDGLFRPQQVVPFQLNKEQAKQALYQLCRKKPLLPRDFTDKAHIEKVTGIYVPFWLNDCYVNANLQATGERVSSWKKGDTQYTKTDVYALFRTGSFIYRDIPSDASKKMDDDMMDALEPFSFEELKEFQMPYLSGYFAQRYDVSKEECRERVKKRIEQSTKEKLRETCLHYTAVQVSSSSADIIKADSKYVMLPVWLLYTKYHSKDYLFAMNGQTGKMVGELPMSIPKAFLIGGIIAAATTILGTIGGLLLC